MATLQSSATCHLHTRIFPPASCPPGPMALFCCFSVLFYSLSAPPCILAHTHLSNPAVCSFVVLLKNSQYKFSVIPALLSLPRPLTLGEQSRGINADSHSELAFWMLGKMMAWALVTAVPPPAQGFSPWRQLLLGVDSGPRRSGLGTQRFRKEGRKELSQLDECITTLAPWTFSANRSTQKHCDVRWKRYQGQGPDAWPRSCVLLGLWHLPFYLQWKGFEMSKLLWTQVIRKESDSTGHELQFSLVHRNISFQEQKWLQEGAWRERADSVKHL